MIKIRLQNLLLLLLFSAIVPGYVNAQDLSASINHFDVHDGLSHRNVYHFAQDSSGMHWYGTENGLNRFDSREFKSYTKESHGLTTNKINYLFFDKKQKLWLIHTAKTDDQQIANIDIFDPVSEKVIPFSEYNKGSPLQEASKVLRFQFNIKNEFYFLTLDHRLIILGENNRQIKLHIPPFAQIHDFYVSDGGDFSLLFKVGNEMYFRCYAPDGRLKNNFINTGAKRGIIIREKSRSCKSYVVYFENRQEEIFNIDDLGMRTRDTELEEKLRQYNFSTGNFKNYYLRIYKSNDILAVQGADYFKAESLTFALIQTSTGENLMEHTAYPDLHFINSICLDREGNWIVTSNFGIYIIHPDQKKFNIHLKHIKEEYLPFRNLVSDTLGCFWFVQERPGRIWHYDPGAPKNDQYKEVPISKNFTIYTALLRRSGKIILGARDGFIEIDPLTFKEKYHYTYPIYLDEALTIWALYEDEEENIWFATDKSTIGYWDGERPRMISGLEIDGGYTTVYKFHKDQQGKTWLVSDKGLFLLNVRDKKIEERYWSGGEGKYYLPYDNLLHLHEDSDGNFWLATDGAGLVQWKKGEYSNGNGNDEIEDKSRFFDRFSKLEGLSSNVVYSIYEDHDQNLWLSTQDGIVNYNRKTDAFNIYHMQDGIGFFEFNRISHHQSENGEIYFGSMDGITSFDPRTMSGYDNNLSRLVITDYLHYDEEGELKDISPFSLFNGAVIDMQAKDKFILIKLQLLNYNDQDENIFMYKIGEEAKEWEYQKSNEIYLSRLPYGNSLLTVKAKSEFGNWAQNEIKINFRVIKPYYLHSWFLLIVSLVVISLICLLFRWRVKTIRNRKNQLELIVQDRTAIIKAQHEELQKVEKLKSKFFANISHELRTPLTLILGPLKSVLKDINGTNSENKQLLTMARNSANQLLKLVNSILDLSKLESGKMELNEAPLALYAFFKPLYDNFESTAILKRFKYELKYDLDKDLHVIVDRMKLETVINNLLSNAFKFTDSEGYIALKIDREEDKLKVSVEDSGKGIATEDLPKLFNRYYQGLKSDEVAEGGTGIGLALCYELSRVLGGSIQVKSVLGEGSEFTLIIPLEEVQAPVGKAAIEKSGKEKRSDPKDKEILQQVYPLNIENEEARILVVEDNKALRSYLDLILSPHYKVETAANGLEGLEILKRIALDSNGNGIKNSLDKSFDLIISDVMMPIMDGYEFARQLKSDEIWRNIPLLILTAVANMEGKLKALKIGVDDYLFKPFEEDELLVRIKTLIANYEQRKLFWTKENIVPSKTNALTDAKKATTENSGPEEGEDWGHFLQRTVLKEMTELEFNTKVLSEKLHISERQLRRKIKQETGLTPKQYILEARLQKARHILENKKVKSVKALAYMTGLRDVKNFSKRYKERFGRSPSSYF